MAKSTVQKILTPVELTGIQRKVLAYQQWMLSIKAYIDDPVNNPKPKLNLEKQYLQFYIDKDALLRIAKFCTLKNFDTMGVFFGVDEDHADKLTACFLGLDKKKNIIPGHCNGVLNAAGRITELGGLPGEENWPPPPENKKDKVHKRNCFTLASNPLAVANYFEPVAAVRPRSKKSAKKTGTKKK